MLYAESWLLNISIIGAAQFPALRVVEPGLDLCLARLQYDPERHCLVERSRGLGLVNGPDAEPCPGDRQGNDRRVGSILDWDPPRPNRRGAGSTC